MAYFVIADENGTPAIFEYPEADSFTLKVGEKSLGQADTLKGAERIEEDYLAGELPGTQI